MKKIIVACFVLIPFITLCQQKVPLSNKFVLVIHGGAGIILKSEMSAEKESAYRNALAIALQTGYDTLKKGGSSLDAVEMAIRTMEDSPLFNAGKGSVFTHDGKNEMDAAIMNGKTLSAGSVAGVTTIKNPVSAARAVMERSEHVMLISKGAEQFAKSEGLEIVDPSYFFTERAWKALIKAKEEDSIRALKEDKKKGPGALKQALNNDNKYGTVGAVALDRYGNLAAATSTGGMTNKKFGRVGDAPIVGAGTYANNATCAISCTGWGEYFIRLVMAKTISDMMEFKNYPLSKAADEMIQKELPALGGDGGLIAVDKNGNISMSFNTAGMYRGYIKNDGKTAIKIYKD
jgi:beta-aspartyl-peptidase (threonine type)